MMFYVFKKISLSQDGNRDFIREPVAQFETEEEAMEFISQQPQNGWTDYQCEVLARLPMDEAVAKWTERW